MEKNTIAWLIDHDAFWSVMTALRGPDKENHSLKENTTEVLRWIVGCSYGASSTPSDGFFEFIAKGQQEDDHFGDHIFRAVHALRKAHYDVSRVPLTAYFSPCEARRAGLQILSSVLCFLEYRHDGAAQMLERLRQQVLEAPCWNDVDFRLRLPNF